MTKTEKVVAGLVTGALVYEGYTIINDAKRDTISEAAWPSMKRPLIPFLLGFVVSHFVWQSQDVYDGYTRRAVRAAKRAKRAIKGVR